MHQSHRQSGSVQHIGYDKLNHDLDAVLQDHGYNNLIKISIDSIYTGKHTRQNH